MVNECLYVDQSESLSSIMIRRLFGGCWLLGSVDKVFILIAMLKEHPVITALEKIPDGAAMWLLCEMVWFCAAGDTFADFST